MRHRIAHKKLNRSPAHRWALRRNMAQSLFEHGQVRTTLSKARDLRPFVERLITLANKARNGSEASKLSARRRLHQLMGDRAIIPAEHAADYEMMSDAKREKVLRYASRRRHRTGAPKGKLKFTAESVTHRLIEQVAPRFEDRPGGYTRIIKLAERRIGDHSQLAILQLVGDERSPGSVTRPGKTSRKKKADARYSFAVKLAKGGGKKEDQRQPEADEAEASQAQAVAEATEPQDQDEPPAAQEDQQQEEKKPEQE